MLKLSTPLSLEKILESRNVAMLLDDTVLSELGKKVVEAFEMDRTSRAQWETRMTKASKIALQVAENKTFPWPGASNVKFPLITIAALQYHSRVYPALITLPDLVQCLPVGADNDGKKLIAAEAVSEHMSWQLSEEDEAWEGEMDRALFVQPLMGCVFKKSYFDADVGHNVSDCVLPQDLVVSYYTKSLESAPHFTHILQWSSNDLMTKMTRKLICETDLDGAKSVPAPFGQLDELRDKSQGLSQPTQDPDQPYIVLEHHCTIDLDGDGYREPYVVLVRYDNKQVLRILPRFLPSGVKYEKIDDEDKLINITPEKFFTKIPFIPSPDGGFYDLGFGHLLGPLNESIDTAINQIFDAATMQNAGGGFLGRGAKLKGAEISFRPNEWKRVDAAGDDLRKSIVELPRHEPSRVLLELVMLLVDFGQRVAGAPDIVQGQNPGQNTPAETSRTMLEQGMATFNGIYKRTYAAMRAEFRKLYRLNQLHLEENNEFISLKSGLPMTALKKFYQLPSSAIRPTADPYYMSDAMKMNQANAVLSAAKMFPGYNIRQVNLMYLKAWKIPGPDVLYPDPKGPNAVPPPVNPKVQIEQIRAQLKTTEMKNDMQLELARLIDEHDLTQAKILELESKAILEQTTAADMKDSRRIAFIDAQIGALKLQQEGKLKAVELINKMLTDLRKGGENDQGRMGNVVAPGGGTITQGTPTQAEGNHQGGMG